MIEDVRLKYACDCTVKTADKPAQPIEKSTAGASMLAQVIVSKLADHQPLHRQERIFQRHGVQISRKTMGGWLPPVAELFGPRYEVAKKVLFESKVIGTDDTGVKVLGRKLLFARTGRIWPYLGDAHHPVVVYDYTPTRGRDGPARFLEGYQGYLQADAYCVYDAFFRPARGLTEVRCMMHSRRYFFHALEADQQRMGKALHLIARLYSIEDRAKGLAGPQRLELRQRLSATVMVKSTLNRICKDVVMTNCVLSIDETRLSGVSLQIVDGGIMDRITVSNITMQKVNNPIFIRLGNRARPYETKGRWPN